ncbi:MAG TPA: insulinase family protein [Jatrophihabitans sp.]|nr:insulinase family protein [Jatrophihabitans sp.]
MRTDSFVVPEVLSHRLGNGLTLTAAQHSSTPLVHAHLAIPCLLDSDEHLAGADVLTATWAELPAAEAFEAVGGKLTISRRRQWVILSLSCLRACIAQLEQVLAEVTQLAPDPSGLTTARSRCAQQATLVSAHPDAAVQRALWTAVYGHLPPLLNPAPTLPALEQVDHAALAAAHRQQVSPGAAHLVLIGDLTPPEALSLAERSLGSWTGHRGRSLLEDGLRPAGRPMIEFTPKPGSRTTQIRLVAESLPPAHPEAFTTAVVANVILGGNFSSRLNRQVRERDGLAYRVTSTLIDQYARTMLLLELDVAHGATAAALSVVGDNLAELAAQGPTGPELDAAVGFILGSYEQSIGSQAGLGGCLLSYVTTGVGLNLLGDLAPLLRCLTTEDVRQIFANLTPARHWGVVAGGDTAAAAESLITRGDFVL